MKSRTYIKRIHDEFSHNLERSALDYLQTGITLFHECRYSESMNSQVALGNLSIAIELILKTFIAKRNLSLLFKDLPRELNTMFICPQKVQPHPSFNLRLYDLNVKSGAYKTLEFNECVSYFYIFFPELKQSYRAHLRLLSNSRNASVHSVFPSFQRYEIERVAFIALQLFLKLQEESQSHFYSLSEQDKKFLNTFEDVRLNQVRKKIEAAKETSKKNDNAVHYEFIDDEFYWEQFYGECPICGNDAILSGYTALCSELNFDKTSDEWLEFYADTFLCERCGLELTDDEELRLAGIDTVRDRSDDLERWYYEKDDSSREY